MKIPSPISPFPDRSIEPVFSSNFLLLLQSSSTYLGAVGNLEQFPTHALCNVHDELWRRSFLLIMFIKQQPLPWFSLYSSLVSSRSSSCSVLLLHRLLIGCSSDSMVWYELWSNWPFSSCASLLTRSTRVWYLFFSARLT